MWNELKGIFDFWIGAGRQDLSRRQSAHEAVRFLGVVHRRGQESAIPKCCFLPRRSRGQRSCIAWRKSGFTQSYTYFAWRNTKRELDRVRYRTDLIGGARVLPSEPLAEHPGHPHEYLQVGGRPAFMARLVLAATLGPNYGIYGPPFEHCSNAPREPGSEEYLDSEKYQIHHRDFGPPRQPEGLHRPRESIRREYAALQSEPTASVSRVDNERSSATANHPRIAHRSFWPSSISIRTTRSRAGWNCRLQDLAWMPSTPYQVHDLLSDARFLWHGRRNYVELNPEIVPAHVFQVRRRVRPSTISSITCECHANDVCGTCPRRRTLRTSRCSVSRNEM